MTKLNCSFSSLYSILLPLNRPADTESQIAFGKEVQDVTKLHNTSFNYQETLSVEKKLDLICTFIKVHTFKSTDTQLIESLNKAQIDFGWYSRRFSLADLKNLGYVISTYQTNPSQTYQKIDDHVKKNPAYYQHIYNTNYYIAHGVMVIQLIPDSQTVNVYIFRGCLPFYIEQTDSTYLINFDNSINELRGGAFYEQIPQK
jgi:hypothetical protein